MDSATPLERAVDQLVDQLLRGAGGDVEAFLAAHDDLAPAEVARLEKLARVFGARRARPATGGALPFERLGSYRLLERLGAGGMGIVYLAEDARLARRVALKVVRPELAASPDAAARFEREARAVAKLNHPHIVTVFDAGHVGDVAYLAMEYVPGRSLDELFAGARAAQAHVPRRDLLRYAAEVARALEAAHTAGVVHRDVKPSNVRVTPDGRALLLDFGLAVDTSAATLSRTGQVQGTLYYAAPEQVSGGARVDGRADLWALGVTLYEGLTGSRPFDGERTEEVLQRVLTSEPVAPRALAPDLPRDVETVVLKALEKDRVRRYPSAAALAEDLEALLAGRPIAVRPTGPVTRAWKWSRRKPAHATSLALGAALLVGGPLVFGGLQARYARELTRERDLAQLRADELELMTQFQGKALGRVQPAGVAARLVETLVDEARNGWRQRALGDAALARNEAALRELLSAANTTDVAVAALRENVLMPSIAAARADFEDQPRVRGLLLHQLAMTAWGLGLVELALETQQESLALLKAHALEHDGDLALATANVGQLLFERGRIAEAEPFLRDGVAALTRTYGPADPRTLITRQNLAAYLMATGAHEECEAVLEDVLATRRTAYGEGAEGTVRALADLGAAKVARGKHDQAEALLRDAHARMRALPEFDPDARLRAGNNLAVLLRERGELGEAIEVLRDVVETARAALGARNPTTGALVANLGTVLVAAERYAEAEPVIREGLAAAQATAGPRHVETVRRTALLGKVLLALDRPGEALTATDAALAPAREAFGAGEVVVQRLAAVVVEALTRLGRHDEAGAALLASRPPAPPTPELAAAADAHFAAAPGPGTVEVRRAWAGAPGD